MNDIDIDIDEVLQRFAAFRAASHEGFQKMKSEVKAEHAQRRARRVQSVYVLGQEAARAGMPRLWPLDDVDDAAADFCAAFFAGYDAERLELQQIENRAALRRNSNGHP